MQRSAMSCRVGATFLTLVAAVASGAQPGPDAAATKSKAQAQALLDSFVTARQSVLDLSLMRIEWRRIFAPTVSTGELESMRERVRTTPGSLERDKLVIEEQRFRGESWLDLVLVSQADSYRLSTDFSPGNPGGTKYDDSVVTPTYAWGLGTRGLRVEGASSSAQPGESVRAVGDPLIAELRRLLAANVDILTRAHAHLVVSSATTATWVASARGTLNKREWEFQAAGTWNADPAQLRLSELRGNVIGDKNTGIRWTYGSWKPYSELGFEVAGDVREFNGDGALASRIQFRNASGIDAKEFVALVALPSIGGSDPVRGSIGDRIVKDSREGNPTYTTYKDGVPIATTTKSGTPGERSRPRFIMMGWVAGPVLLVGFIAVVMLRRRGARHA